MRELAGGLFVVTVKTLDDRLLEVSATLAAVEIAPLLILGIGKLETIGTWSSLGFDVAVGLAGTKVPGGDSDANTYWTMVGISACMRGVLLLGGDVVLPCLSVFNDFLDLLLARVILWPPR